jgi:hypothetical protein
VNAPLPIPGTFGAPLPPGARPIWVSPEAARYAGIPAAMRGAKRWLLWQSKPNPDTTKKPRKVPFYSNGKPRTGTLDTPEDQASLAPFDDALLALQTGRYTGLGFALGPDGTGGHWQGIDLDGIDGKPALQQVSYELPGYTETSPSGTGRHAIGYGRQFDSMGSNTSGIEAYAAGRYFTVTGAGAGGSPECLADFVEARLKPMHGAAPRTVTAPTAPSTAPETISPDALLDLRSALLTMPADDRGLWVDMGLALKALGDDGRELWLSWSATCPEKYDETDAMSTWQSFRPERTGYKAVFAEAQRHGWENPRTGARAQDVFSGSGALLPPGALLVPPVRFKLLTPADLAKLPPVQWRVRGVLPTEGIGAVFGPSGSGKSFLVLDQLAAVAAGREWFGCRVTQSPVLYVALEGEAGIAQRVKAYQDKRGALPDGFRFLLQSLDIRLAADRAALVQAIQAAGWRDGVLCLDTLNRAAPGMDENDSRSMGEAIGAAKAIQAQLGGMVLLVHHTGKDATKGLRGHSSLHAALDAAIEVTREGAGRVWTLHKAKDGEDGRAHPFRLDVVGIGTDDEGEPITSCVVVPEESAGDAMRRTLPPKSGNQKLIWEVLAPLLRATCVFGSRQGMRLEEAIEKVRGHLVCDPKRQTERTQTAISGLVQRGVLKFKDDWIWIA